MPRLPIPGGDAGNWGEILNEFLSQEHNADGTLKPDGSLATKYAKPMSGIPKTDLHNDVQTSLDKADAALNQAQVEAEIDQRVPITQEGDMVVGGGDGVPTAVPIGPVGGRWTRQSGENRGAWGVDDRVYVTDYGAVGDNVADDTPAIQSAITAAGVHGVVVFPTPSTAYRITEPLVPLDRQHWIGPGWHNASSSNQHIKADAGLTDAMVKAEATVNRLLIENLSFRGPSTIATPVAGSKGIYAADANDWILRNLSFHGFGAQAVHIAGGSAGTFEKITITGALTVRTGYSDYVGAFDIATSDPRLVEVTASTSSTADEANGGFGDGWLAAIVVRGAAGWIDRCTAQISQVGIVLINPTGGWRVWGNRADLNYGPGWVVNSGNNIFFGNHSYRNGQAADDTHDGFVVSAGGNLFIGNKVAHIGSDPNHMRHGFTDATGAGAGTVRNQYVGNDVDGQIRQREFNFTGSARHAVTRAGTALSLVTSAYTTTPDDEVVLCDASGGAFTVTLQNAIGLPRRPLTIKRTSASNTVTVDGAGSQTIDKALTKTLGSDGAFISIVPDGANWQIVAQGGTVT